MESKRRTVYVPDKQKHVYRFLNHRTGEIKMTPDMARLWQELSRDIAYQIDKGETYIEPQITIEVVQLYRVGEQEQINTEAVNDRGNQ